MSVARVKPVDLSWFERLNTESAPADGSANAIRSADQRSSTEPAALTRPEQKPTVAGDIVDVAAAIRNAFGIPAEAAEVSASSDGHPTLLPPTGPVSGTLPRLLESTSLPSPMTSPAAAETPAIDTRAAILPADENWAEALDSRLREMTELASAQPHWQAHDAKTEIDDRHMDAGAGLGASEHGQQFIGERAPFASLPLEATPQRASMAQRTTPYATAFDNVPAQSFGQPDAMHPQYPPAAQFNGASGSDFRRKGAARVGVTALRSIGLAAGVVTLGIALTSVEEVAQFFSSPAVTPANAEDLPALSPIQLSPSQIARPQESSSGAAVVQASAVAGERADLQVPPRFTHISVSGNSVPLPTVVHEARRIRVNEPEMQPAQPIIVAAAQPAMPPATVPLDRGAALSPRPRLILDMSVPAGEALRLPFPLQIQGSHASANSNRLVIRGLPEHATLSRGRYAGPGEWHLPFASARDLHLSVPPMSAGEFEMLIELWSAEGALVSSHLSVVHVVPRPKALVANTLAASATISDGTPMVVVPQANQSTLEKAEPSTSGDAPAQLGATGVNERALSSGPPTDKANQPRPQKMRLARTHHNTMSRLGGPTDSVEKRGPARKGGNIPGLFAVFDQGKGI